MNSTVLVEATMEEMEKQAKKKHSNFCIVGYRIKEVVNAVEPLKYLFEVRISHEPLEYPLNSDKIYALGGIGSALVQRNRGSKAKIEIQKVVTYKVPNDGMKSHKYPYGKLMVTDGLTCRLVDILEDEHHNRYIFFKKHRYPIKETGTMAEPRFELV